MKKPKTFKFKTGEVINTLGVNEGPISQGWTLVKIKNDDGEYRKDLFDWVQLNCKSLFRICQNGKLPRSTEQHFYIWFEDVDEAIMFKLNVA